MKKIFILLILTLAVTSCGFDDSTIGIIGGADGPTAIVVGTKADGSTAIVVKTKADELDEMPVIDGLPTPPGDFESASQVGKNTVIVTENVTADMRDEYISRLEDAGFAVGLPISDGDITAVSLENERYIMTVVLNKTSLTTTVTEK